MLGNTKIFSLVIACPLNFHFFAINKGLQLFFFSGKFLTDICNYLRRCIDSVCLIKRYHITKIEVVLNTTKHLILIYKMCDYNHTYISDLRPLIRYE